MPKFHPPGLLQALALALSAVTLNLAVPASASSAHMRVPEAPATIAGSAGPATPRKVPHPRVSGIDVSHYQGKIDWRRVRAADVEFAYIKATQGNSYKDPRFNENYQAATRAGLVRGAYHFATPNSSSGRRQADFVVAHGGGWSADDRTLPAMLDLEANKRVSKDACYGLTDPAMVRWIRDFADRYHKRTSRWPVIYTSRSWWTQCTGNSSASEALAHSCSPRGARSPERHPAIARHGRGEPLEECLV